MHDSRSDLERNVAAMPEEGARDVGHPTREPDLLDNPLLPAAAPSAPVRDLQHWLDLCG
jgi:hypothetical protein